MRAIGRLSAWRAGVVMTAPIAVVVALVVAACGPGGAPPGASASVTPSLAASAEATAVPAPTQRPNEPPPASLAAEGGDPVVGQLGSFTWGDAGSDSPWLPGAPIRVGAGEQLTLTLGDGSDTGGWSVRRTPAERTAPPEPIEMAQAPGGPVTFVAPPPGRWSVQVDVRFGGSGSDSAAYYWLIDVG